MFQSLNTVLHHLCLFKWWDNNYLGLGASKTSEMLTSDTSDGEGGQSVESYEYLGTVKLVLIITPSPNEHNRGSV